MYQTKTTTQTIEIAHQNDRYEDGTLRSPKAKRTNVDAISGWLAVVDGDHAEALRAIAVRVVRKHLETGGRVDHPTLATVRDCDAVLRTLGRNRG